MLPYHTVFVLQQERLGRYQAEAKRAANRAGLLDSVSRVAGRILQSVSRRNELRLAV